MNVPITERENEEQYKTQRIMQPTSAQYKSGLPPSFASRVEMFGIYWFNNCHGGRGKIRWRFSEIKSGGVI